MDLPVQMVASLPGKVTMNRTPEERCMTWRRALEGLFFDRGKLGMNSALERDQVAIASWDCDFLGMELK